MKSMKPPCQNSDTKDDDYGRWELSFSPTVCFWAKAPEESLHL